MAPRRESEYVEFVTARQAHLRRIAYAISGDWHRADDLLQTALVKLYVAWPRVRRDGNPEAYLRRILVNADVDERRRPWRRERPGLPWADGFDSEDRAATQAPGLEETDELLTALHALPAMQRKVVVLRHWLDLSVRETADELGISEGTVKSHSARGLSALQATLTPR